MKQQLLGREEKEQTEGIRKDRMWGMWVNQVGQTWVSMDEGKNSMSLQTVFVYLVGFHLGFSK